jgi:hypothetical protein
VAFLVFKVKAAPVARADWLTIPNRNQCFSPQTRDGCYIRVSDRFRERFHFFVFLIGDASQRADDIFAQSFLRGTVQRLGRFPSHLAHCRAWHSNEKPGGYSIGQMSHIFCSPVRWQRAETILGTPSPCLNSACDNQSTTGRTCRGVAFLARMHLNVMCDLAHVCQLDGCAQRLGSAKHQRKLAPPDCF